jgi:hypothetical protein
MESVGFLYLSRRGFFSILNTGEVRSCRTCGYVDREGSVIVPADSIPWVIQSAARSLFANVVVKLNLSSLASAAMADTGVSSR